MISVARGGLGVDSGFLPDLIVALVVGASGFASAKLLRLLERWRLGRIFGGIENHDVRVVMSVWEVAEDNDGERLMVKNSQRYGRDEVRYLGNAEMTARADVSAMSMVVDTISKVSGISANAAFDSDSIDINAPTVLIGSSTANDATKYLMETLAKNSALLNPLTINVDRIKPDSLIFHATKSGKSYSSNAQCEYAVIARYSNPFGHSNKDRVVMVAGQFANGTYVAGQYFSKYWRRAFRYGRQGVVLEIPTGQHGPIRVVEYLR